MSLVHPALLLLALAAVPVVMAFLRRPPPRTRAVSSLLLLRAVARLPATRRRLRLRHLLSLALVLIALMLAVLAVATRPDPAPRVAVVVLDTSAAMGAKAGSTTWWAEAVQGVSAYLDARPDDAVAIWTTSPPVRQLGPTRDHARVRELVASLSPSGAPGDLLPALRARCAGPATPVVLWRSPTPAPTDLGCPVLSGEFGVADDNSGLVAARLRMVDGLGLAELYLRSTVEGTAPATLAVDGVPVQRVALEPEGMIRLSLPPGERLTVTLEDEDALETDNVVALDLPRAAATRVCLRTDQPDSYLAEALSAHPAVLLDVIAAGGVAAGECELGISDGSGPPPDAPFQVVWGATPATEAVGAVGVVDTPTLATWARQDALLQFVDLEGLHIAETAVLAAPEGATVLMAVDRGPIALRQESAAGGLVVMGFDLERTDLALRVAFVNLVANLVDWSRGPAVDRITAVNGPVATSLPDPSDDAETGGGGAGAGSWLVACGAVAFALLMAEWLIWLPWARRRA